MTLKNTQWLNETSVQLHRIELQRIIHLWAVFLGSGLQEYWLRDQIRVICSYLEDTVQEVLRFQRPFQFLNKMLGALWRSWNQPTMQFVYWGSIPFVSQKVCDLHWKLNKISHNLFSKRFWNVLEISKLEQCHSKIKPLNAWSHPKIFGNAKKTGTRRIKIMIALRILLFEGCLRR